MRQKKLAGLRSRGACMQPKDPWTIYRQRFEGRNETVKWAF